MPSGPADEFPDVSDEDGSKHKRTPSGGLLSRLPFLRTTAGPDTNGDDADEHSKHLISPPVFSLPYPTSPPSPERHRNPNEMVTAATIMRKKTRSRKGSLRKTALLGTGKLWRDQLETIASPRLSSTGDNVSPSVSPTSLDPLSPLSLSSPQAGVDHLADDFPTPRASDANGSLYGSSSGYSGGGGGMGKQRTAQKSTSSEEGLTLRGPRGRATRSDVSTTTDEEESLDGGVVLANGPASSPATLKQLPEDPTSYFSLKPGGILRRYSSKKPTPKSPLGSMPMETSAATPEEWDYAETEWWGWIILIVTWIVFVVGMGSCFGVWSWAWDVGETPYAPPELEDDPTLPIVGYYPALIILTGVMAWVWVIIAWVGMKYFKHAKMSGEE